MANCPGPRSRLIQRGGQGKRAPPTGAGGSVRNARVRRESASAPPAAWPSTVGRCVCACWRRRAGRWPRKHANLAWCGFLDHHAQAVSLCQLTLALGRILPRCPIPLASSARPPSSASPLTSTTYSCSSLLRVSPSRRITSRCWLSTLRPLASASRGSKVWRSR